ncbi:hypothetical protein BC828DRAFT_287064 [Blastocladiella britannica]|nr:hypothetical protein BC828DRAFT_287064 [Blastocladiella britannica]
MPTTLDSQYLANVIASMLCFFHLGNMGKLDDDTKGRIQDVFLQVTHGLRAYPPHVQRYLWKLWHPVIFGGSTRAPAQAPRTERIDEAAWDQMEATNAAADFSGAESSDDHDEHDAGDDHDEPGADGNRDEHGAGDEEEGDEEEGDEEEGGEEEGDEASGSESSGVSDCDWNIDY